jgi:glycosyltransferase involved in cell wall biosynthesis
MRPLRIALVAAGPDGPAGGQAVQARLLADLLREAGHEVDFVPIDPLFPRGLRWLRRVPCARTLLNQALYLPSLGRIRRSEVVHVFSASFGSFFLAPAPAISVARLMGRRVVLNYHSGEADEHLRRDGFWVEPWLRRVHALVVPSAFLRRVFERHGHRAQVIPNVVELSRFAAPPRPPGGARLLSTRNLERIYGLDTVVRAFARLRQVRPAASLTLAGSGSQEGALRRLAESLGVTVAFTGRVEPSRMPGLYREADVFLNASVVDNQPLSVLEAFASGLPVVTTPTGDIASMVSDGETGLLVPPGDPEAMARAVCRLWDNPALAASIAARARGRAVAHSWSAVRPQWEAVLSGASDSSRSPRALAPRAPQRGAW